MVRIGCCNTSQSALAQKSGKPPYVHTSEIILKLNGGVQ
jgi:hypothetical protein